MKIKSILKKIFWGEEKSPFDKAGDEASKQRREIEALEENIKDLKKSLTSEKRRASMNKVNWNREKALRLKAEERGKANEQSAADSFKRLEHLRKNFDLVTNRNLQLSKEKAHAEAPNTPEGIMNNPDMR